MGDYFFPAARAQPQRCRLSGAHMRFPHVRTQERFIVDVLENFTPIRATTSS